ncbi:copper amine oxidase [Paenibacillus sp. CAA11]|uniref:stalk domain-containing protein n=1 Tax=Paenibacillus sp. CAA11 TaxID=1532905 RepID=UPI000D39BB81|nr:stalk domain-containing protein [Paenibacillus sp. CAA11]AWB46247.1 copper amine oxidase [Paenibacillus sp. CAA11]
MKDEYGYGSKPRKSWGSKGRKLAIVTLAGLIWIGPALGETPIFGGTAIVHAASSKKLSEEIITSGAKLLKYQYTTTRSGKSVKVLADVIRIDLDNPYVKLDVMTGKGGKVTTRQSVEGMAKETGAVAGVNADFFNTSGQGVAMGASVASGILLTSPNQLKGMYAFYVTKDGKPAIDRFTFEGSVKAEDGSTFPLAGMNKEAYKTEPDGTASHYNAMYIYTSAWASTSRPKDGSTTPTEILVRNGVVEQISAKSAISGPVPEDGYILRAHGTAANYALTHLSVGQHVNADYQLRTVSGGKLVDPASLQMMVGGHTLLVNDGKPSSFTRSTSGISGGSAVARTAIGYSQDGRYAYLITAQDNSSSSGMKLTELQNFMTSIGVWKGLDLDGGGSTTMVTRPLGETEADLTFTTSNGGTVQRQVVNGVGVYTTAPQGQVKGLTVNGTDTLVMGQEAKYSLKGYDTYYNPIDTSTLQPTWKSSNGNVVWTGSAFKAVKPGTAQITAVSGQATATKKVTVLGADSISTLSLGAQTGSLKQGSTVTITPSVKLKDGRTVNISASALKWEFIGIKGSVQNGVLTVQSVNSGVKTGYAIARYDGFSAPIMFTAAGEQSWEDFENVNYGITFTPSPAEVTGKVQLTTDNAAHKKVLKIDYDLTAGTGNKYAYAQLNGTTGRSIPAGATAMSIDVKGDQSLNWARAEFEVNGKTVYVDLARPINFSGWKTVDIDLSSYGITTGAKLKRLYIVNVDEGRDERSMTGSVAFDNIRFTVPSGGGLSLPSANVQMVVGQKSVTVNGQKRAVEVAPVVRNETTYVPIRYVLDYFGGQTGWSAADQRIMALRGSVLLELTVGSKDYVYNGKRKTAEVTPLILQNRTLVPLRLVSEQLGISVKWEQKTKAITLQS